MSTPRHPRPSYKTRAARHNHPQEEVVRKLEKMGVVVACYNENELPTMIEKARTFDFKPIPRGSASKVINDFLENF